MMIVKLMMFWVALAMWLVSAMVGALIVVGAVALAAGTPLETVISVYAAFWQVVVDAWQVFSWVIVEIFKGIAEEGVVN